MDGDFTASLGSLLQWLINPTRNCRQGRALWYIAFTVHSSQRKAVKNVISSNLNVTHLLVQCCVYYIISRPKEGFCLPQCGNVYNTSRAFLHLSSTKANTAYPICISVLEIACFPLFPVLLAQREAAISSDPESSPWSAWLHSFFRSDWYPAW